MRGFLITNNDTHTPEAWAAATSGKIMEAMFGSQRGATPSQLRFALALNDIFLPVYTAIRKAERSALNKMGDEHLAAALDPTPQLEAVIAAITEAAVAAGQVEVRDRANGQIVSANLAQHVKGAEVQAVLRKEIGVDLASAMDVERSYHADKSDGDLANAYRCCREAHGAEHVHALIDHYKPGGGLHKPHAY